MENEETNFGKYLQNKILKPRLQYLAERGDEWHLCFGKTKSLKELTAELNGSKRDEMADDAEIIKFDTDTKAKEWFEEKFQKVFQD